MPAASIKDQITSAFKEEFKCVENKFEIINLLEDDREMDSETIASLKLPSDDYNIIWHPGVYVFLGNNVVYRVGVSMENSRKRVMQHLEACTNAKGYCVWDIQAFSDKAIILFNAKNKEDFHWLKALEIYLEKKFTPLIPSLRT